MGELFRALNTYKTVSMYNCITPERNTCTIRSRMAQLSVSVTSEFYVVWCFAELWMCTVSAVRKDEPRERVDCQVGQDLSVWQPSLAGGPS